jgi:hypothetical protein
MKLLVCGMVKFQIPQSSMKLVVCGMVIHH